MKHTSFFTAILAAGLLACSGPNDGGVTVKGVIDNANGTEIALLHYKGSVPDTLGKKNLAANGQFSFDVPPARLSFYTLAVGDKSPVFLAFDSTSAVVKVSADYITIDKTYEVSGSSDSEDVRNFFVEGTVYEQKLDSTMKAMQAAATSGDQELRVRLGNYYNDTRKAYREYLVSSIESNPSSVANYSILQRLDPMQDIELYRKVSEGLGPRMRGNFFYDALAERIEQVEMRIEADKFLSPGSPAPDIVLPNPDGKMVSLSSLKGKYVLIDFWASWCKPCRMENPNVVKMYNKYKKYDFEILGVSLDRDRTKWLDAIAEDKLTWPHVSDLQFWNSAAAKLYNVQSIPFTLLVDPDGNVVDKNLRGRALEQKMEEIFGA